MCMCVSNNDCVLLHFLPTCLIQLVIQERLTSLHQRELPREMAVIPLPLKMLDWVRDSKETDNLQLI